MLMHLRSVDYCEKVCVLGEFFILLDNYSLFIHYLLCKSYHNLLKYTGGKKGIKNEQWYYSTCLGGKYEVNDEAPRVDI